MKKFFYSMFAMATMLLATSCSGEEEIVSSESNETVKASFTLDLGEGLGSRTVGDGLTATDLYCGVFDQKGNVIPGLHQQKTLKDRTTTVEFTLVKGQTYDFVFWAQAPNNKHYDVDKTNLTEIKVNYNQPANAESRDAFLGKLLDYKVEGHFTKTVYLYRPFAQLNVGTTLDDYKKATELLSVNGITKQVNKSNLVISKAYTTLNTLTSQVGGETNNVQLTLEGRPNEYLYVDIDKDGKDETNTPYEYLSLNYLLAKEGSELFDVKVQLNSDDDVINTLEVPSVPLQRNYRTNIIGNLLTTTGDFTVIVDNKFLTPNHIVEPWNGKVKEVTPNAQGEYEIYEPAELAWIAQEVNAGEDFASKTIRLMDDLDLNNYQWTPIGNYDKPFNGTLDGKKSDTENYTIKNLLVNTSDAPAGLFGRLGSGTVKNLNIEDAIVNGKAMVGVVVGRFFNGGLIQNVHVKNANVEGHNYVGGIAGHAYGHVKDCSVTNVTVVAKPEAISRAIIYQDGAKAGGIIGYLGEGSYAIENNTVTNAKITGYRDLGGIIGAGHINNNVKNNTVKGTLEIIIDNTVTCYDENGNVESPGEAKAIVGRTVTGELDSSNTSSEATVTINTVTEPAPEGLVQIDDTNWKITNMEGLFEFAKSVNEEGKTYSGATVKLTADIALAKAPWTPIGLNADGEKKFHGTFDGQGHTITDLYVETEAGYTAAGFFGALNGTAKNFTIDGATIKHISTGSATDNGIAVVAGSIYNKGTIEGVTVKNAVVEGNRYVGGISGYTYGSVKNCVVENITLTATPNEINGSYDNGDKIGGIAGYFCDEDIYVISGNKVLNAKITGYRDMGGVVGCADDASYVKENSVNVATLTIDQKTNSYGVKDENAGAIVGRVMYGSVDKSNTIADVNIILSATGDKGLSNAIASGATEVTLPSGTYSLPTSVNEKTVTIIGTKETIIKTGNGNNGYVGLGNANITFDGVTIQGQTSGQYNGYAHAGEMTYNNCTFEGTITIYSNSTFTNCTFNLPKDCYVWTAWGADEVTYDKCTFNTAGKALLVYHENGTCTVNVNNCTFNASDSAKAGAIANQNCAAIEIDNSGKGVGTNTACHFTLNTSGNVIDNNFSGEWRIKTIDTTGTITVNKKKYTTLALDGKTMTIDANKNVAFDE